MPRENRDLERRLGEMIGRRRSEIVREWLDEVRRQEAASGIPLTELVDAMPDYLDRLREALFDHEGVTLEESGRAAWRQVAREHALTRVRLGFDIGELVREFVVLRRVLRTTARGESGLAGEDGTDIFAELIEAAIGVAVGTYVDARDYETRRVQAANIGFVTHELRNPLAAATLAVEQLHRGLPAEPLPALAILSRNLERLRVLVEKVHATATFDAGGVECHPAKTTLEDVIGDALASAADAARRKGLAFSSVFDPKVELEVDPALTRSAVQNLVDNAVKYTDEGRVDVSVDEHEDELVIHVRDTCHGLSAEELSTIFEPFVRGHSHSGEGSGLGLAIARRAVVVQGGRLEAESPGDSGCHFWITMPRRVGAQGRAA